MPTDLHKESRRIANFREHIFWAHRWTLFWAALSIGVFVATYAFCAINETPETNRTLMYIALATILIISAIWQATGLALARLESLILVRGTTQ